MVVDLVRGNALHGATEREASRDGCIADMNCMAGHLASVCNESPLVTFLERRGDELVWTSRRVGRGGVTGDLIMPVTFTRMQAEVRADDTRLVPDGCHRSCIDDDVMGAQLIKDGAPCFDLPDTSKRAKESAAAWGGQMRLQKD